MKKITISLCVLFLIGIYFIFNSFSIGESMANAAVTKNGGSIDTNIYVLNIQENTKSIRTIGTIIALVSAFGAVFYRNK
jgi:hypothetical protein